MRDFLPTRRFDQCRQRFPGSLGLRAARFRGVKAVPRVSGGVTVADGWKGAGVGGHGPRGVLGRRQILELGSLKS